ncbi:hypothetical protein [Nocardioides alkalitolerans]|uniref:hypothetical protein n=1 Tax=Nocardioides alkalitolerans TaxID=281714 RepID=UPI0004230EEA|nr:hypothetical protein [Nocardioides alkalitolerans]
MKTIKIAMTILAALVVVVLGLASNAVAADTTSASANRVAVNPFCGLAGAVGADRAEAGCEALTGIAEDQAGDLVGGVLSGSPVIEQGADAVGAARGIADFISDPFGHIAEKLQASTKSLVDDILPTMTKALQPDLSAEWFVDAYQLTFTLSLLLWILQLVWSFAQYGRGRLGPGEVQEVILERTPLFFAGVLFGPAVAVFFVGLFGALTNGIIDRVLGRSLDSINEGMGALVESGGPDQVVGGAIVAIILYLAMVLGLLCLLLTLAVMLVTLYLSGVAFPLVWQWVTNPQHPERGWKVVGVWGGILVTQPLMFLMLGVALNMAAGTLLQGQLPGNDSGAPNGLRLLVGLLIAGIGIWMAALTPVMMSRFAPVWAGVGEGGVGLRDLKPRGGGMVAGAVAGRASSLATASRSGSARSSRDGGGRALAASLSSGGMGAAAGATTGGAGGRQAAAAGRGAAAPAGDSAQKSANLGSGGRSGADMVSGDVGGAGGPGRDAAVSPGRSEPGPGLAGAPGGRGDAGGPGSSGGGSSLAGAPGGSRTGAAAGSGGGAAPRSTGSAGGGAPRPAAAPAGSAGAGGRHSAPPSSPASPGSRPSAAPARRGGGQDGHARPNADGSTRSLGDQS